MQRVIAVKWSLDNKFILSGSEEMNLRVWKANSSAKLGVVRYISHLCFTLSSLLLFLLHIRDLFNEWVSLMICVWYRSYQSKAVTQVCWIVLLETKLVTWLKGLNVSSFSCEPISELRIPVIWITYVTQVNVPVLTPARQACIYSAGMISCWPGLEQMLPRTSNLVLSEWTETVSCCFCLSSSLNKLQGWNNNYMNSLIYNLYSLFCWHFVKCCCPSSDQFLFAARCHHGKQIVVNN